MTKNIEISLSDLRKVINGIFDHMEKDLNISSVDLQHDYYHEFLLNDGLYQPEPAEAGMGQLYDDWEFLQPLLKDKGQYFTLMFDHVAPLLRYIAYRVGQ